MGPYRINLKYYGVCTKTITNLSKKEAASCFFAHFDNFDGFAEVVLGDIKMSGGQAMKHFGKRKAKAAVIISRKAGHPRSR